MQLQAPQKCQNTTESQYKEYTAAYSYSAFLCPPVQAFLKVYYRYIQHSYQVT